MKKLNQLVDDTDILQASMLGGVNDLTPSDVQSRLQALMLEKMEADQEEVRQRNALKKRQRESIAKEAQRKREHELAIQNSCDHKKPNGSTALCGMYNHGGKLMCVCQNCGKEWIDNNTPQHLLPSGDSIGGVGVR